MCFWEYFTWDSWMRIWGMGPCIKWFNANSAHYHLTRERPGSCWMTPEKLENIAFTSICRGASHWCEGCWHDVTCLGADSAQMPQYRHIIRLPTRSLYTTQMRQKNGQIPSESPVRLCLNKSWSSGQATSRLVSKYLSKHENIFCFELIQV